MSRHKDVWTGLCAAASAARSFPGVYLLSCQTLAYVIWKKCRHENYIMTFTSVKKTRGKRKRRRSRQRGSFVRIVRLAQLVAHETRDIIVFGRLLFLRGGGCWPGGKRMKLVIRGLQVWIPHWMWSWAMSLLGGSIDHCCPGTGWRECERKIFVCFIWTSK